MGCSCLAMGWTVIYSSGAEKDLGKLDNDFAEKIIERMDEIKSDPHKLLDKMVGVSFYKFRMGDYRGIVEIITNKLILHVIKIKHRSRAYGKK